MGFFTTQAQLVLAPPDFRTINYFVYHSINPPTLSSTFTSAGAGGSRCLPQELGSSEFTPEKWWVGRRAFPVSGANLLLVSGRVYLISLHCFSKYRLNGNTTPLKSIILWCEEVAYQELFVLGIQSSHETRGSRKASCQAV